ncbi:MAG: N-acetyltransferase, partial [Clostridia bacterium]|nr:N-acetyltransferase [Clostridia bacterium]
LEVPSTEDFAKRIANISKDYPWIVCEQAGRIVGYAYSARHAERAAYGFSANLSVYVDPDFSRRGIGRLLCREIMELSRDMGICHLFSAVTVPNVPSFALHRDLGFEPCGYFKRAGRKFGTWRDLAWFEIELSDQPPAALLPAGQVLEKRFGRDGKAAITL